MNGTSRCSTEISQTALALLALLAAGKSLDPAMLRSLRSLVDSQIDFGENRVNLTVFADCDDEDNNASQPVIIPFSRRNLCNDRCHNAFGALSLKNEYSSNIQKDRMASCTKPDSRLRIFSPDTANADEVEDEPCLAATVPVLRLYAE